MEDLYPDEKEMIESLRRSGYLLESQISKYLSKRNFFVETNQVIIDPYTEKSREIDIVAEYYNYDLKKSSESKCVSKIKFVFEIKNNSAPIVLLTNYEHSPNIEDWLAIKERQTFPPEMKEKYYNGYWENLIQKRRGEIFTQYCSFQRKKNNKNSELMALHPDNIHTGLNKITQYCEEYIENWGRESIDETHKYFRNFIALPVLLIDKDLYELKHSGEGDINLEKTECSMLVNNYHYKGEPSMAYVFVVTKKGFPDFIDSMLDLEKRIEDDMREWRKKTVV